MSYFLLMAARFWTADWHLGGSILLDKHVMKGLARPFKSIDDMKDKLIASANMKANQDDVIIHLGDFASYRIDRGYEGLKEKPNEVMKSISAKFINLRGNHDINNNVFCLGNSLNFRLSRRYPFVSASHYPTYDKHSAGTFFDGTIHLCGHVHGRWKHCLDLTHSVLNINVGVDVWNYQIVSEPELISYIDSLFKKKPEELFRVKTTASGKIEVVTG